MQKAIVKYDLEKDFAPISMAGSVPVVLVVHPSLPAKSLQEFIAHVKAKPGELTFASAGNGSTQHLAGELFELMTKLDMVHVPYKGSAPAITDLLGGQVSAAFETVAVVSPHIKAGKLRALAVASKQRVTALPDVPTAAEAGLPIRSQHDIRPYGTSRHTQTNH